MREGYELILKYKVWKTGPVIKIYSRTEEEKQRRQQLQEHWSGVFAEMFGTKE